MPDPTDSAAPYRDLLAAIRDALDIPFAHFTNLDAEQTLRNRRVEAVGTALHMALNHHGDDPAGLAAETEHLRRRTSQLPVTYRRYIGTATDHPADCVICGPGCCSPVLGIHSGPDSPAGGNLKLPLTQLQVAPSVTSGEAADVR